MADLFSGLEAEAPLEQLVAKLDKPSPEFLLWLRAVEPNDLETILEILKRKGAAKDKQEGLEYLQKIADDVSKQKVKIVHHDFGGERHTVPFRELQKVLQAIEQNVVNRFRLCGMVSHELIGDFLIGRLPDYKHVSRILNAARTSHCSKKMRIDMPQLELFEKSDVPAAYVQQGSLFAPEENFMETVFFCEILPDNKISAKLEDRITRVWQQIIRGTKDEDIGHPLTIYSLKDSLLELYLLLLPIFEPQVNFLKNKGFALTDFAFGLTILCWASIVVFGMHKNGKRILFREVPIKPGVFGRLQK